MPTIEKKEQELSLEDCGSVYFQGRRAVTLLQVQYFFICVLSLGIVFLFSHWFPEFYSWLITEKCTLQKATHILVTNVYDQFELRRVQFFQYEDVQDGSKEAEKVWRTMRYFEYRCIRFTFDFDTKLFFENENSEELVLTGSNKNKFDSGLSSVVVEKRRLNFGRNLIEVEKKSNFALLMDEVLNPFNVFQMFSCILWISNEYMSYAIAIALISTGTIVHTFIATKKTIKNLDDIAKYICQVTVRRSGRSQIISSVDLVPGDVVEIDGTWSTMPCDMLLINGDAIVDESMLTGESVPVSKDAIEDFEWNSLAPENLPPKHMLYAGTAVIRARGFFKKPAYGLVMNTGFNTAKGHLVRAILFPKPTNFKFYKESFQFLFGLGWIAVAGLVVTVVYLRRLEIGPKMIIQRSLDLITIILPPALPATLSIGSQYAVGRLKDKKIFCISPAKVIIGGKINLIVFDKTGTLTEDGLQVHGIQPSLKKLGFQNMRTNMDEISQFPDLINCMASCHSLKKLGEDLVGDPLEIYMFRFTNWVLEDSADSNGGIVSIVRPPGVGPAKLDELLESNTHVQEIGIVKTFDFNVHLRRMSVIVKKLTSQDLSVYVKGAPESLKVICDQKYIPHNFDELLSDYAQEGFRVVACASKVLKRTEWAEAQTMTRDEIECNLKFLGFIIFENKLKPVTTGVISKLQTANFRTVMCTGDNLFTAISVSKACGLVDKKSQVYYPKFAHQSHKTLLVWENQDDQQVSDFHSLLRSNIEFACTGDVFENIIENFSEDMLQVFLVKCQIFARMSPDQKQILVEQFQKINYCVSFVGDGANDCGALKSADVGVSISAAEASIAAPLTSQIKDISCIVIVIQEGRSALVTNFSLFKYMAFYSFIQFTTVSMTYFIGSNLSDTQYLYIDLVILIGTGCLMARFNAAKDLLPKPPTAKLISPKVMTSLIGQIFIQFVCQLIVICYLIMNGGVDVPVSKEAFAAGETNVKTMLTTTGFLYSLYLYVMAGFLYCDGKPYRQSVASHWKFVLYGAALFIASIYLNFWSDKSTKLFFETGEWFKSFQLYFGEEDDSTYPKYMREFIAFMAFIAYVVAFGYEYYICPLLIRFYEKMTPKKSAEKIFKTVNRRLKDNETKA